MSRLLCVCVAVGTALLAGVSALAQPVITMVTAQGRPTAGGAMLQIQGTNFGGAPVARMGGVAMTILGVGGGGNTLIAQTVAGQGTVSVTVEDGAMVSNSVQYTYDGPRLFSISPPSGSVAGGGTMAIQGENFGTSATVTIGGAVAPSAGAQTHTQVMVTVPGGVGTNRAVVVTVAGQSSFSSLAYSYDAPFITSISPDSGPTAGGTVMTIGGFNLGLAGGGAGTPAVSVGGVAAPVVSVSPASVQVTVPAGAGTGRAVSLTVGGQTTPPGLAFSYNPPLINTVSPISGPTAGGQLMTIDGGNFGPSAPTVTIGGAACAVQSSSHTSITALTPAGQGSRPLVVTVAGQTSPGGWSYFYDAPFITGISPVYGPAEGGAPLIIDGQNFGTAPSVTVGGLAATIVSQTHTRIVCTTPVRAASNLVAPVRVSVGGQLSNLSNYVFSCGSDANHNGVSNVTDIFDFLNVWFAGCP